MASIISAGTTSGTSLNLSGDTSGVLQLATNGSTTAVTIDTSQRVGIGTSSPTSILEVTGGAGNEFRVTRGTNNFVISLSNNIGGDVYVGTSVASALLLQTSNTERMRIDTSGNVGIGSTSPLSKLEVVGGQFRVANTSTAAVCIISTDSTSTNGVTVESSYYGGAGYGPMKFNTGGSERMRIDSSGNLLVGATSLQTFSGVTADHALVGTTGNGRWVTGFRNNGNSNPWGLAIGYSAASPNNTTQAFLWAEDSSGLRFNVRSNGGIGNYQANDANLSDEREKANIQLAGDYLNKICAIPVKTFNYIDQNLEEDDGLTLGVIAQDVQKVAPELISESNWGTEDNPKMRLAIYQTDLQYALMKAIQELKAELDATKAEVAALKGVN